MSEKSYSGTVVAVVVFAALVGGVAYRYWPSEDREVRRHLSNLAEALSLSTTESEALRLTRFAAMREYFDEEVRVRFDDQEIRSRQAVFDLLSALCPPQGGVAVEFVDVDVAVSADAASAQVVLNAKVATSRRPEQDAMLDTRRVRVAMVKWNGDWVISSVEAEASR